MKWYLFTMMCFVYAGHPICNIDVRFDGRAFRSEAECDYVATLLGRAAADIGGYQVAYSCTAAVNLDAALLKVLGQLRS